MKTLIVFLMVVSVAIAQDEPTPAGPSLESRVRDIAGLVVQNTDQIKAIEARVRQLEDKVFGLPVVSSVVETIQVTAPVKMTSTYTAPTYLYSSPIAPPIPRIKTVYPRKVIYQGGSTGPVRSFFRCIGKRLFWRKLTTKVSGSSSGHWTIGGTKPGNVTWHLINDHGFSSGYVNSITMKQRYDLHDQVHNSSL